METTEALRILEVVTGNVPLIREDQIKVLQALQVLKAAMPASAEPEVEEPAQ